MAADFPATTYSHSGAKINVDVTLAEYNQLGDEIEAIEETLGANVHQSDIMGTFSTVDARLERIETVFSSIARGILSNLFIFNDATYPNYKVTCTADVMAIGGYVVSNFSKTADITTSGAGGLDAGTEDNVWYFIWAIYDPTGGNSALMLSISDDGPTMPGNYTEKRRVGAVRNYGGNFLRFVQQGDVVMYDRPPNTDPTLINATFTAYTPTELDATATVPATSRLAYLNAYGTKTGGVVNLWVRPAAGADATYVAMMLMFASGQTNHNQVHTVWVPLSAGQLFDAAWSANEGGTAVISIQGYKDNL